MSTRTPPGGFPSHRQVWAIAAPMILTNVSIPLLGIVDTAVLGHLPDPTALGAVAIGGVIFSFVFWGFGFLRMGTTGFVARDYGREDRHAVSVRLFQALLLALLCAGLLLLARVPIREAALWITSAEAAIEAGAGLYFDIRMLGAPATLASHALVGWYLGIQNARIPMAMLLSANLTNVVLDLRFVVGLGWGVRGVAWASVIGEVLGVAIGLALIRRSFSVQRPTPAAIWRWDEIAALVRVNRDIMLRTFCLIFVFAFIPWWGARLGTTVLAANAVLINFQHFASYALDGFAHAAEALAGRALGAGRAGDFRRVVLRTGQWSLGVAVLFAGVYGLTGGAIVRALTDLPEVRSVALTHLPWMILLPAVSVWSFWLDGVFIGCSWAREMLVAMFLALLGGFLPAWWLSRGWGNHGLWLAFTVFMAVRALIMGLYYRRCVGRDFAPATGEVT